VATFKVAVVACSFLLAALVFATNGNVKILISKQMYVDVFKFIMCLILNRFNISG
jgi:hypothetical protein